MKRWSHNKVFRSLRSNGSSEVLLDLSPQSRRDDPRRSHAQLNSQGEFSPPFRCQGEEDLADRGHSPALCGTVTLLSEALSE